MATLTYVTGRSAASGYVRVGHNSSATNPDAVWSFSLTQTGASKITAVKFVLKWNNNSAGTGWSGKYNYVFAVSSSGSSGTTAYNGSVLGRTTVSLSGASGTATVTVSGLSLTPGTTYYLRANFAGSTKSTMKAFQTANNTATVSKYDRIKYTISYNKNGGSGTTPSSQTKSYGVDLTLRSTSGLSKTGYHCVGWSTSSTATSAEYSSEGTYTANADATLYAVWVENTLTVKYYGNGATGTGTNTGNTSTGLADLTTTIKYSKRATANLYNVGSLFTRTYYHANAATAWRVGSADSTTYWNHTTQGIPESYFSSATNTVNLYANWVPNTLTINYYGNGATGTGSLSGNTSTDVADLTTTVSYGSNAGVDLYDVDELFTKTGYTRESPEKAWRVGSPTSTTYWNEQSQDIPEIYFESSSNNSVDLYVNWVLVAVPELNNMLIGDVMDSVHGEVFIYYNIANEGDYVPQFARKDSSSKIFTTPLTKLDSPFVDPDGVSYNYRYMMNVSGLYSKGDSFDCWVRVNDTILDGSQFTMYLTKSLVFRDYNGEAVETSSIKITDEFSSLSELLPIPSTRSCYLFNGWYDSENSLQVSDRSGTVVASGMICPKLTQSTVYIDASYLPRILHVSYNINGGTITGPEQYAGLDSVDITYTYDEIHRQQIYESFKSGGLYNSLGIEWEYPGHIINDDWEWWYFDSNSVKQYVDSGVLIDFSQFDSDTESNESNLALYINWDLVTCAVRLTDDKNGTSQTIVVNYGETISSLPSPTYEGYTFNGWMYNSEIITTETVIYTSFEALASWSGNVYTVTLNPGEGTVSETSITVTYGSTYPSLPTPHLSGSTFVGWYLDSTFTRLVSSTTVVQTNSNHTLYAKFVDTILAYYAGNAIYGVYLGTDEIIACYRGTTKIWSQE